MFGSLLGKPTKNNTIIQDAVCWSNMGSMEGWQSDSGITITIKAEAKGSHGQILRNNFTVGQD